MLTGIDRLATWLAIAAGIVLTGLVFLTFADVLLRYLWSAPIRGRQDVVEMGMVIVVLLAAPYAWRTGDHITVDLLPKIPVAGLEILRSIAVRLAVAGVFAALSWLAWKGAEEAELFNEATNMILIPHRPFMLMTMVVCAFHAVLIVVEVLVTTTRPAASPADDPS